VLERDEKKSLPLALEPHTQIDSAFQCLYSEFFTSLGVFCTCRFGILLRVRQSNLDWELIVKFSERLALWTMPSTDGR